MYKVSKIAEKARELCQQFPDTVYEGVGDKVRGVPKCLYTKGKAGNGCGCIVGQAAILAYPELKIELEKIDSKHSVPYSEVALYQIGVELDNTKDQFLLNSLQSQQDMGRTWGEALNRAEKYVNEFEL